MKNDSWASVVESLLVSVIPEKRRPILFNNYQIKKFCDCLLVVAKAWELQGAGSFIDEPLAADLFRAVAYKHIQQKFEPPSNKELKAMFLKRLTKRKIINTDEVYRSLQVSFHKNVYDLGELNRS